MEQTYLTTEELSQRIKYDSRTIRERLMDSVLIEGVHYIRPFGGRKILFIWESIQKDIGVCSARSATFILATTTGAAHALCARSGGQAFLRLPCSWKTLSRIHPVGGHCCKQETRGKDSCATVCSAFF